MKNIPLSLVFIFVAFFSVEAYGASKVKKVCVASDGKIFVRSKCKKQEKVLSSLTLNNLISTSQDAAGPAGPQGEAGTTGVIGEVGPIGPQGPQGVAGAKGPVGQINFSQCRISSEGFNTNFLNPTNPVLYAEAFCDPNTEYILEDESRIEFFPDATGSKVALQGRLPYYQSVGGDNRPYGVGIFANRFLTVGSGVYQIAVRAVCCPR